MFPDVFHKANDVLKVGSTELGELRTVQNGPGSIGKPGQTPRGSDDGRFVYMFPDSGFCDVS